MFKLTSTLRRATLGLALAACSLLAHAGKLPVTQSYHVALDTTGLTGGFVDFNFSGLGGSAVALATISGLHGANFGAVDYQEGDTSANVDDIIYTIGNRGAFNDLTLIADFGALLSFEVNFTGEFLTGFGSDTSFLSIALLDSGYGAIGDGSGAVNFALTQLGSAGPAHVAFALAGDGIATVTTGGSGGSGGPAVPEPADWLIMLTGLACVVGLRRRRSGAPVPA